MNVTDLTVKEVLPGFRGRFVHGDKSSLAIWNITKGSTMPEHAHLHEQITYVVAGAIEMIIGGTRYLFTAGDTHVIPSMTPHSAVAKENCQIIDAFSPARDDYR